MTLPDDFVLNSTCLFNTMRATRRPALKVHHDAAPEVVAAARRLFEKGLVSQRDGGYLTKLGQDAAEHLQLVRNILDDSAGHGVPPALRVLRPDREALQRGGDGRAR